MKKIHIKSTAMILMLIATLVMLSACNGRIESTDEAEAGTEEAVATTAVTIEADGKQITIEDVMGKTIQQLLDEADITLNEGDVISIVPEQEITGSKVVIQILRRCKVLVITTDGETQEELQYTVVLVGGTVADAIEAAGITLAEDQIVDHELDAALENEMVITISIKEEEEEETEETETQSNSSWRSSTPASNSGGESNPAPAPVPDPTPVPEEPVETPSTERTIVSQEDYPDCDGSGHGVIVYTYSDGTQEEVPY